MYKLLRNSKAVKMIRVEYDKETHELTSHIKGDSELLLFEFNILTKMLLESFNAHGQVTIVLDEILDVVSDFAEEHTPEKTKGEKKDD